MILIFSTPREKNESFIKYWVLYWLFLCTLHIVFKLSPFHVCINTWPKNYNLSWEKVFFLRKHSFGNNDKKIRNDNKKSWERKKKKLMFPRSLFTVSRTKNIFFHSVFALCGQSGIESKDWTLHSSWSTVFFSFLFVQLSFLLFEYIW